MRLRITVLPGDGIGPEVTTEAVRVLETVAAIHGYTFEFQEHAIGGVAIREFGSPLPRKTLDACLASDAVLLGAVGAPEYDRLAANQRPEAGLLLLRRALGGYANLRPAISYAAIADCSPLRSEVVCGADILFVRELLGGLYFGEPRGFATTTNGSTVASNTMRYSVEEIERVARVAFEAAQKRRGKVTSVDKANVLETSQLWRQTVTRVAEEYPDVSLNHLYVDACAMHLVTDPKRVDAVSPARRCSSRIHNRQTVINRRRYRTRESRADRERSCKRGRAANRPLWCRCEQEVVRRELARRKGERGRR